ncbi:MAG: condensation domain-containing protein [Chthoniobacter sp.]
MFTAYLRKVSENEHHFVWSAHHIIFDGQSLSVFARDLALAWRGELPATELRFANFVGREQHLLQSGEAAGRLAFWKEYLAAPQPTLQYPLDRPRPAVQTFVSERRSLELEGDVMKKLDSFAQEKGTDLRTVLLTTYLVLLHRHTNQDRPDHRPALGE